MNRSKHTQNESNSISETKRLKSKKKMRKYLPPVVPAYFSPSWLDSYTNPDPIVSIPECLAPYLWSSFHRLKSDAMAVWNTNVTIQWNLVRTVPVSVRLVQLLSTPCHMDHHYRTQHRPFNELKWKIRITKQTKKKNFSTNLNHIQSHVFQVTESSRFFLFNFFENEIFRSIAGIRNQNALGVTQYFLGPFFSGICTFGKHFEMWVQFSFLRCAQFLFGQLTKVK